MMMIIILHVYPRGRLQASSQLNWKMPYHSESTRCTASERTERNRIGNMILLQKRRKINEENDEGSSVGRQCSARGIGNCRCVGLVVVLSRILGEIAVNTGDVNGVDAASVRMDAIEQVVADSQR